LLNLAHTLADHAGRAILPHFRTSPPVDNKGARGAFDPVTAADRAAERAICRLVAKAFPDHGVIGEEFGAQAPDARFRWIIDPIDGTRGFIAGTPMWGTLIGLVDGERPVLGLMDQPFTRERFWSASTSSYARRADGRARRLATRACPRLEDAILMTTAPELFAPGREQDTFARARDATCMVRYGGDCYAYCLLACGCVDLVIEAGLEPYDIVALIPIIERAGGRVTTWDGEPATAGGRVVASGDPRLHDRALKLLAT
jgi:myo-inositol-1(or 4)-monophosphatase